MAVAIAYALGARRGISPPVALRDWQLTVFKKWAETRDNEGELRKLSKATVTERAALMAEGEKAGAFTEMDVADKPYLAWTVMALNADV